MTDHRAALAAHLAARFGDAPALPDDLRGDLIFTEPVGRLVRRTKIVKTEGSTQLRNAYPFSEFIMNTDPLFRPVNTKTAPDGSLYIVDMYHGIIQDTQWSAPGTWMNARVKQLQLDKVVGYGRIWRLRYDGIKAYTSAVAAASVEALSSPSLNGAFVAVQGAVVDAQNKTVTVPAGASSQFLRLSSGSPITITGVSVSGGNLVIRYQ